jgi:hypothetical protein
MTRAELSDVLERVACWFVCWLGLFCHSSFLVRHGIHPFDEAGLRWVEGRRDKKKRSD